MKEFDLSSPSMINRRKGKELDELTLDEWILNGENEAKMWNFLNGIDFPIKVNLKQTKAFYVEFPKMNDDWCNIKLKLILGGKVFFETQSYYESKLHCVDELPNTIKFWFENEDIQSLFGKKKSYKDYSEKKKLEIYLVMSTPVVKYVISTTSSIKFENKCKFASTKQPHKKETPVKNFKISKSFKFPILDNVKFNLHSKDN